MLRRPKIHTALNMTHSLDRLTERERDLLTLLAQGHTAKTIANSRALSVNVVNEYLRSARRKTGAPSSRELARLVVGSAEAYSQENRDNLLEIESSSQSAHGSSNQAAATGAKTAWKLWVLTMIIGVLLAAGVFAYQMNAPGQGQPSRKSQVSAESAHSDVIYQVLFKAGDEFLGAPTVSGQFGQEVRVEVPNRMRAIMIAEKPDRDGKSYTSAKMAIFENGAWQPAKEMSMRATLSATPSFEYSVEGTPYRFVVMPRLIVPAAR